MFVHTYVWFLRLLFFFVVLAFGCYCMALGAIPVACVATFL